MFGVLIIQTNAGELGYLAAFSGILVGSNRHPFFVPPVYDLLQPGGFFKQEEAAISLLNTRIKELEENDAYRLQQQELHTLEKEATQELNTERRKMKDAKARREERRRSPHFTQTEGEQLIHESQYQKAEYKRLERRWKERINTVLQAVNAYEMHLQALKHERKTRSADLQQRLFAQFRLLNYRGEIKDLCEIFADTVQRVPPAGAGECAAPKLLQYAYLNGWKPIAMAEFWWGASPQTEIRKQGNFYPSCTGKCGPILHHMLQGLDVEPNPLAQKGRKEETLRIIYEDNAIIVIDKPAGMLSVPGKEEIDSVYSLMRARFPQTEEPLIVHRLDMDTSGLLLLAKTKEAHQHLQTQFEQRLIRKRYIALLDGVVTSDSGRIDLPLSPDWYDRPRQMVNQQSGKAAVTDYQVLERRTDGRTLIAFYPLTGRTHQLRVHAAHPLGLHCPIVGDALYGQRADRLYLHADMLEFTHPSTGQLMHFCAKKEF